MSEVQTMSAGSAEALAAIGDHLQDQLDEGELFPAVRIEGDLFDELVAGLDFRRWGQTPPYA